MIALLLAALVQNPPDSLDARIDAFLKGDAAARAELVKLGAYAIRPLQRAEGKNPKVVDALVYELKLAAAYPQWPEIAARLDYEATPTGGGMAVEWAPSLVRNLGLPAFADEIDFGKLKAKTFDVRLTGVSLWLILDDICRQTGLEWGLFHHHVVIGHPDRLWPSGPPVKIVDLTEEAVARAKKLVERLADESIEVRESASKELMAMGPAVVKLLESNLARREGEIAARCATIVENLRVTPKGKFGKSGADRQDLSGEDEKLSDRLRAFKATVNFDKQTLRQIAEHFAKVDGLPIDVDAAVPDKPVSVSFKASHVHDILALITQSQGLDFTIRNGRIRIGK